MKRGPFARAAVVLALVLASPRAGAQVPGEEIARRAFEEGVLLEKQGDFSAALAKFKESSQIKGTLGNRFHIAYCLEMTGKLAAALNEYEVVDKTAREQNKSDLVEATRVRLEPLRTRVPLLSLRMASRPNGAEVSLDGVAVAPALLDGLRFRIDPGQHTITARAPEHEAFTKSVTAADGANLSVEVDLKRPAPASTPPSAPAPEKPRTTTRTLPIVTTAGAIVLAAVGAGAFVLAGSEQEDAEKSCLSKVSCEDEASTVRTLDALALGGFIGAAGLAALSIVLWSSPSTSSAQTSSRIVARSSWLGFEGSF